MALRVLGPAAAAAPLPTGPSRPAPDGRLPKEAREPAEELVGFDFSAVRVHTGTPEAEGAHAVTRGRDIYFAPGRYWPDHPLGRALIAHELTHVAQQRAAPRREPGRTGAPSDLLGTPARRRADIGRFRAERDDEALESSHAALADPLIATTPAPRGLRQRCDGNGNGDERDKQAPPPSEGEGSAPPKEEEREAAKKPSPAPKAPVATPASLPSELATYYADIDGAVKALNDRLKPTTPLDPDWLRAMMAVESAGEASEARKYDPLQTANKGDPAFPTLAGKTAGLEKAEKKALLAEHERTKLIDPAIAGKLAAKEQTPWTKDKSKPRGGYWDYSKVAEDKRMDPKTSVAAAAAWLFHKAAKYENVVVEEEEEEELTYTIESGDSFAKIAKKLGTTQATLTKYNPDKVTGKGAKAVANLRPGDVVKYRKARLEVQITGWRSWRDAIIAYNSKAVYYTKVKAKYDEIKKATAPPPAEGKQ